jgi:guanine deaminase
MSGKISNPDSINGQTGKGNAGLTCYLGHIVSPISESEYADIRDGALIVDQAGVIVAACPKSDIEKNISEYKRVIDYGKRLILPGFVDTHSHLPQIPFTGRSGKTLLGWLDTYAFPAEASFSNTTHAEKVARWYFDELARNGTTCAVVFTTIHKDACDIAFQTALAKGSRVIMGKVMMDANSPQSLLEDTSKSLAESEELCQLWHGADNGRLLYAFTPRFAITSSEKLLAGCGQVWERNHGTYLHTHLAETQDEVAFVAKQFPKSRSYLDVYKEHGLIGTNSVLAHAIYLDDQDLSVLQATNSALSHCPSSNFFLKSGTFLFRKVQKAQIKFGLGCDVAGGPEVSMFDVMKNAAFMQKDEWISPTELFYYATLGGARAINLDNRIGNLKPGREADFIVVDPSCRTGVPKDILEHKTDEILSSMIYLGDDRFVVASYVRGRQIHTTEKQVLAGVTT